MVSTKFQFSKCVFLLCAVVAHSFGAPAKEIVAQSHEYVFRGYAFSQEEQISPNDPILTIQGTVIQQNDSNDITIITLKATEIKDGLQSHWRFPALEPFVFTVEIIQKDAVILKAGFTQGKSEDSMTQGRQYRIALTILEMALLDVLDEAYCFSANKNLEVTHTRFDAIEIEGRNINLSALTGPSKHKAFTVNPIFSSGAVKESMLTSTIFENRNVDIFTILQEAKTKSVISAVKFSGLLSSVVPPNSFPDILGNLEKMSEFFSSYEFMELEMNDK